MANDKKLDDIILFPGSVSELREVIDADVKIASPNLIRLYPKAEVERDGFFVITYHLRHFSIDDAEKAFRKLVSEQGFSGVVHYVLLTTVVTKVKDVECPPTVSHGCQGIPITIKPRSYRE